MTQQVSGTDGSQATAEHVNVGDWLVVPLLPPTQHLWRWGRITGLVPGTGPIHYRVRWIGDTHDVVVLPPPDSRIESATDWPHPGGDAIGVWTS